jgi:anti-sigma28 factor (negative regulator of flagellin synthesis)
MKVTNANLSPLNATDESARRQAPRPGANTPGDDFHLSELVRSLRALAADSPERQERLERIAREYAKGTYKVDAEATAAKVIDDALQYPQ